MRMPNWLGDLIMSTPVLMALRKCLPNAHITALCQSNVADLLLANPHVDKIWNYNKPKNRHEKRAIILELKEKKFDTGVLLTNSISSAWWFFRGNVKNRIGFSNNIDIRSILLSQAVSFPKNRKNQHLVLTYLSLLGANKQDVFHKLPELYVTEKEKIAAKKILKNHGWAQEQKIIGICPGAAFGTAKRWLPERFRAVAEKLSREDSAQIIFLGNKSEIELSKTICQAPQIINLVGKTSLRELISIISVCDVFLANDSGPMHIAAALQTPLVALFGPTDATVSRPYPNGKVIQRHVSCSPCHRRECPHDHACMKAIGVDEVYEALREQLSSPLRQQRTDSLNLINHP